MTSISRQDRRASLRAAAQTASSPPVRLGSWDLVARVGNGALCEVYAARSAGSHVEQAACYALKLLRETWQFDPRGREFLRREVQVSRQVTHPHLVPILAAELETPPFYVAMPLLDGCSLDVQLAVGESLDLPTICWIARQVAEALAALDHAGWMHGDIKPSNVMLSATGHVTLIDLGFASQSSSRAVISTRPLLGTTTYMAPELLYSSCGGDIRSDVYSLGVMLFELLTGRLPFDAADVRELAMQHRQEPPREVRALSPHVPVRAARLVQQMLAKEPLRRPLPEEVVERLVRLEIETFGERFACELAG